MRRKKDEQDSKEFANPATEQLAARENVTVHLDRDPNDPRNVAPAPELPTLDDEGQS